ncbi:MAG: hypothetical protein IPN05_18580 [Sulfuritalea sp.]|nr:hypothetical protein [Sulfuritalea sp.]
MRIVLHETEILRSPRALPDATIARFSHLIEIRQSPDNLRHLADAYRRRQLCDTALSV